MSDRPKQLPPAEPEPLESAFTQIDLFKDKLDDLKRKYNETAKEVAALGQVVTTPIPPPMLIDRPHVEGRYSINTPLKSERPGPLERPPVPRPTPRVMPAVRVEKETMVPSRPSGRFYIQIPKGASADELGSARDKLSKLGRVVDSGAGTASRPEAGWIELAVRDSNISELIAKLRRNELQEYVEKVIEVAPGEGRIQARQIDLFRIKGPSDT